MNVKRLFAIPAALLPLAMLSSLAHAQSNVTLYGVVDSGVAWVNGVGAKRDSAAFVPNLTGTVPSRWGMRGSEDLGGGNKAIFWLESGFGTDTSVAGQGGRIFGRQALVGLSGQWGQVAFGRQYTMLFWAMAEPDMLGPNIFGSASFDTGIPNARSDNTVSYKGTFGGVTVGGTYSVGRDAVNAGPSPAGTNCAGESPTDSRACREWSALLKYDAATWSVGVAYDSQRGGPGAFGGLTNSSLTDDRLSVNGYFMLGQAKIGGGWLRRDNEGIPTPVSDLYYFGASYPITPSFNVDGEAFYQKYHNSANKAWMLAARGTYLFSKRTSVYGTVGYIANSGQSALSVNIGQPGYNPAPGGNQLGAMIGVKQVF